MTLQALPPQELIRKTIIEVVSLPEKDLLSVLEFVGKIKQREREGLPKFTVAEIRAEASRRTAEVKNLSREEIVKRFNAAVERIRAQAIANGTAIEGDWERD